MIYEVSHYGKTLEWTPVLSEAENFLRKGCLPGAKIYAIVGNLKYPIMVKTKDTHSEVSKLGDYAKFTKQTKHGTISK